MSDGHRPWSWVARILRGLRGPAFPGHAWARHEIGQTSWYVDPEWADALIDRDGLPLARWEAEGRLTLVKQSPYRRVYRVELEPKSVYIKHFLVPDVRTKLRQWVRRGKARNEGRRAIELAATGIPTLTPLALGERRRFGLLLENFLITEEIPETTPLDGFLGRLGPGVEPALRRRLATELAGMTARLHHAGYVHQDFHPGNILIRTRDDRSFALAMIDLDALRRRVGLGWSDAGANLACLNHYFWNRCHRSDRLRFLTAYLDAREVSPPEPGRFAREIESATRAWAERLWRRWGRRGRRKNKYFRKAEGPNVWGIASRQVDKAGLADWARDPDLPFRLPTSRLLKESKTTTVAEVTLHIDGAPVEAIYKRFQKKKRLDPLLSLLRASRGWHSWEAGQHLASRGLPTPANLAYFARRWPSWMPRGLRLLPAETYVVTRKVEAARSLDDHLRQLPEMPAGPRESALRGLAHALARLLRDMHGRALSHRDLKAANILLENPDRTEAREAPRIRLIDLVGVDLSHPLPMDRRIQNLARLHVSVAQATPLRRAVAWRFLRDYGWPIAPDAFVRKSLWRATVAKALEKRAKNRRTGRALS